MFNKIIKTKKTYIQIYDEDKLLFQGLWNDIPLDEDIIIQRSIEFFNDPTPCYIHRTAVRVRILEELEKSLLGKLTEADIPKEWLDELSTCLGSKVTNLNFSQK